MVEYTWALVTMGSAAAVNRALLASESDGFCWEPAAGTNKLATASIH